TGLQAYFVRNVLQSGKSGGWILAREGNRCARGRQPVPLNHGVRRKSLVQFLCQRLRPANVPCPGERHGSKHLCQATRRDGEGSCSSLPSEFEISEFCFNECLVIPNFRRRFVEFLLMRNVDGASAKVAGSFEMPKVSFGV